MAIASFEPQEEEFVPSSREKSPISRPLDHKLKNRIFNHVCAIVEGKKANISAPWPQIEKIMILCFLKL